MQYNKPPLTYLQQISLMEERGLVFTDKQQAENILKEISYYRLSAYSLAFQQSKDLFNPGVEFESIVDLYLFDKELRLLVFDAIERIEVAIRAQIIYQLSHKYGAHWQDNSDIFVDPYLTKRGIKVDVFSETQRIISDNCNAHFPEVFIKHYKSKYDWPKNPPSWMCIELVSMGQLSRIFASLKSTSDRRDIANHFNLHHTLFQSWLHSLTYVRNICAHHSRLWNREFAIQPEIPIKKLSKPWIEPRFANNNRCFYFLCILKYLLGTANSSNHLTKKIEHLIAKYPNVPIKYLGIPSSVDGKMLDWLNQPLWKNI